MLLNQIKFTEIGDVWLFAVKESDALLLIFAGLILAGLAIHWATRPQPVPDARRWGVAEAVRRHPSGKS